MLDPIVKHSYVQVNESFVHLAQYGFQENFVGSSRNSSSPIKPSTATFLNTTSQSARTSASGATTCSSSTFGNQNITNNDSSSGISLSENSNLTTKSRRIIVFIPGNPGVLGIYHDFLISLYKSINKNSMPLSDKSEQPVILAIGHNNFDHPDHVQYRSEERICVQESDLSFVESAIAKNHANEPHHIELQIINKLIILKKLLKVSAENCKFVFIGHSIGCYIILKLLQDTLISSSHVGSVLIHPVLENLATTPRGLTISSYFHYKLDLIAITLAIILDYCVPQSVRLAITRWFCNPKFIENSSSIAIESVAQLACQKTCRALIQMAKSELAFVKHINTESMIKPHETKLKLIYAINDGWVNNDNKKLLRDLYPDLYIEEQPNLHAFVMDPKIVMDYAIRAGNYIQDFYDDTDCL